MKSLSLLSFLFISLAVHARDYLGPKEDIDMILSNIKGSSSAVMNSEYQSIGDAYSDDAKIFPNN